MTKTVFLGTIALVLLAACGCGERKNSIPRPPPASSSVTRTIEEFKSPKVAAVVLTEEKMKAYLAYSREMAPMTAKIMQEAKGIPSPGQAKEMQSASDAAMQKAGLTLPEMQSLSLTTGEYFGQRYATREAEKTLKEIAQRKTADKPDATDEAMVEVHQQTVKDFKKTRADFVAKYGAAAADLLDKYEPEFSEITLGTLGGTAK